VKVGQSHAELTERGIRLTRVFAAPPATVFQAWADPASLDRWWGPSGFRNETHSMAFKPGGAWLYTMHSPDGVDYPNRIIYQEIEPPRRLAFLHDGGEDDSTEPMQVTVTFEEHDGQTRLTMHTQFASAEMRDQVVQDVNAIEGGQQTLQRLAEHLTSIRKQDGAQ